MRIKITCLAIILLSGFISLNAQDFYKIQNRWKADEYIHVQQTKPASGPIQPGWWSAQWILEPMTDGFYHIKNRWKNEFLHIENNTIECGAIQPGWWSAQWALEPVAGTSFVRIRSRWKPDVALNNEHGSLEAGQIDLGWWSAQWQTVRADAGASSPVQPSAATTTAAVVAVVAARNSDNPGAFNPEHGGRIEQVSLRYTDQISVMSDKTISVGSKIYFFPQEVIVNSDGLSFDPKNPAIGGQIFTVIQVTPLLKLDRPMPMMRNRNNDYIGMVVEVY